MFRKWNWLIFLCLFITCLTITGIWMRRDNQPEPITSTTTTTREFTLLGTYTITAYNALSYQTDNSPCISASGMNICEAGELICACPREFEFGTEFFINDRWWNCQDRMAKRYREKNHIDILMKTVEEAKAWGVKQLEVYVKCNK